MKKLAGDENTTMYERNIFSRLKSTVLLEGGPISTIKWNDRFVAWTRKGEVRVYDSVDRVTISRIPFNWSNEQQGLKHSCNIFWKDPYTLFIGWGDSVKVCQVKKQDIVKVETEGARAYFVQISTMFTTDFWVCGISCYEQQNIVLLGKEKDERINEASGDARPKLHIVQPYSKSYSILCTDVLQVKEYQSCTSLEYHLESLHEELLYFVVSPKDVILAKNRDHDDRIQWLIEHK